MAWLGTWAKRKKIEIDNTNIDSSLTHFPLPIFLGTSVGQNNEDTTPIFDEVGSSWQKIAVTKADGTTELYVEKEKWDSGAEEAVLWVSKSDWSISNSSKTTIYIYYDSTQSDNTTYVADTGSRTEVWDSNYKAVYHLGESSGSAVDSTSNNNNGTFNGDLPTPISALIGEGQDLDGTGDRITIADSTSLDFGTGDFTISAWGKPDGALDIFGQRQDSSNQQRAYIQTDKTFRGYLYLSSSIVVEVINLNALISNWGDPVNLDWVCDRDDSNYLYKNGSSETLSTNTTDNGSNNLNLTGSNEIGSFGDSYGDGAIDEVRISDTARSSAWIKADYHAQTDDLIDWYAEEERAAGYTQAVII
jgi:hypothetical protein